VDIRNKLKPAPIKQNTNRNNRNKYPQVMTDKQNLSLLLHMIDATSMQLATIKDSKLIKQKGKERLTMYFNFARMFTKEVENLIPDVRKEDYNDRTAYVYEIMKACAITNNPGRLLALIESDNRGEIQVTECCTNCKCSELITDGYCNVCGAKQP
jgi:hypothetical protein